MNRKQNQLINLILLINLICLSFSLSGCGKKANPVVSNKIEIAKVTDLSYNIDKNILELIWSVDKKFGAKKTKQPFELTHFIVYRSREKNSANVCKTCPVHFKRVAKISASSVVSGCLNDGKFNYIYQESLKKEYRYIYKVVAFNDNGLKGRDSNFVNFVIR